MGATTGSSPPSERWSSAASDGLSMKTSSRFSRAGAGAVRALQIECIFFGKKLRKCHYYSPFRWSRWRAPGRYKVVGR